jgi:arylsulfatase A-like enzyme
MYAEFVSTMDERIGRVLEALENWGLRDNTLIIFQSDHGHSAEERAFFGGGSAGPYRGAKGGLFEGGLRVPSLVSLPGVIPAGQTRDQLAVGCDWLPTISELCGAPLPERKLDGKSLASVLASSEAASPHKSFYWQLGAGANPQWVVRQGPWKLLGNPRDTSETAPLGPKDKLFLANLDEDVAESRNVADEHPDVLERLMRLREAYVKDLAQP